MEAPGPDHRQLPPAVPAVPAGAAVPAVPAGGGARRSTRDWIVDSICFLLGFGFTVLVTWDLLQPQPVVVPGWTNTPLWLIWVDFAAGTVTAAMLWWRRRWPVGTAVGLLPLGLFTVGGAVSGMILVFSVGLHRRWQISVPVAAAALAVNAAFTVLRPEEDTSLTVAIASSTAVILIVLMWGMMVRSRRQLLMSLRDRAERAEAEQQLRVAQARALERTRIAREMHDVLAHRISLLSLHAGALEIRPDASSAEVAGAAGVIRASAHQALQDLREVIGVLREDPGPAGTPERPQPTLAQLPQLVDESRAAGTRVRLEMGVDPAAVPDATGRAAYRIVQEGLTNARKHAPGALVTLLVAGGRRTGLSLDLRNGSTGRPEQAIPGAGTGLIGLAERATLAGGRLTHGRLATGEFALSAWLPWPRS